VSFLHVLALVSTWNELVDVYFVFVFCVALLVDVWSIC